MSNKQDNVNKVYEPTWESLDKHEVPEWFDDAKFGIMIHWGPYSVPAWAPKMEMDVESFIKKGEWYKVHPYSEWYVRVMQEKDSPTWKYHVEHYGKDFGYDGFIPMFKAENWDPSQWASLFKEVGAKYVILVSQHGDGFSLWPSKYTHRNAVGMGPHRDIVGDLARAVRGRGLRIGFYHPTTYSWWHPDFPGEKFVEHTHNSIRELIGLYHPFILWGDTPIGLEDGFGLGVEHWRSKELIAYFYNQAEDPAEVAVNNRWGIDEEGKFHGDFDTPEYAMRKEITERKWESVRGIGKSFAYNRNEGPEDYISVKDLVQMLVDIVSKNGNFLLDVGPKADGSIPEIQVERLRGIGQWLDVNGEAIYGTRPWFIAEDTTDDGISVRYTKKEANVYAVLFDWPGDSVTLKLARAREGSVIRMLGVDEELDWEQDENGLTIKSPSEKPCNYAYAFRMVQPKPFTKLWRLQVRAQWRYMSF